MRACPRGLKLGLALACARAFLPCAYPADGPSLAACRLSGRSAYRLYLWSGNVMLVKRRTWFYRLANQPFAEVVSFDQPVTAAKAREMLRRSVGTPVDLWGRNNNDI